MYTLFKELDQSFLDTVSSEQSDVKNSKVWHNPEIEKLATLTDQQLKDLRGDLEVKLHDFQHELRVVENWDEEPTECNNRTIRDVEFDIDYTLDKIDTINSVYKRRVEERGEVYTDLYFCN